MIEQHDFNKLELGSPNDTDNISAETDLVAEAALLQILEVQTEAVAERQRRISARIHIPYSVEQVWQVLTHYEGLAEFIPNLTKSRLLKHPTGGIRLEQVGSQRLLRLNFSARVVLDLEEKFPHEINFKMVEGDFKEFSGSWFLEPYSSDRSGTDLRYSVLVWPKRTMPISIIERRLANDLQRNLLAVRQRTKELFG